MEIQNPSFNFPLEYGGQTVDCAVTMKPESYEILFDGRYIADIAFTDDLTWIQESGVVLPASVIDEIGLRVESEYN